MYQYTDFDTQFVKLRAAQHRDQLERWQAGQLSDDEFRPLRLQNGWYVQRYAPMLRVAVPYGELSSAQVRVLAKIAREYDRPDAALLAEAQATQDRISDFPEVWLRPLLDAPERAVQLDPAGPFRRRDGPAGQREPARHPDQRQLHPQHHQ